jgi:hypothetical protein
MDVSFKIEYCKRKVLFREKAPEILLNNKFKLNCKSQQGRAETLGAVNQRIP